MKALIAALATAALGMALLFVYMKRFEEEVKGGVSIEVLVAKQDIPLGAQLDENMVAIQELPRAYLQERNIKREDAQRIFGVRVRTEIRAGDALLWSDLATTTEQNRGLSGLVREGMRAVNIGVGGGSLFGGLVRPGDRMDVLLTMEEGPAGSVTVPLLQNIMVLAVGTDTGAVRVTSDDRRERVEQVTLAVTVEQAQLLTFGASRGTMSLTLRNPDDITVLEELPETRVTDIIEAERRARVQRRSVSRSSGSSLPGRIQ